MTISELEEASGVSRRTIHFYVKEGVLPPPEGRGGGARYSEEHFWRLKLIRNLQDSHLKLAGIKEELDGLTLGEMKSSVQHYLQERSKNKKNPSRRTLRDTDYDELASKPRLTKDNSFLSIQNNNYSFLDWDTNDDMPGKTKERRKREKIVAGISSQSKSKKEVWQRIHVAEGVELNIREDVLEGDEKAVEQILREISKKLR